MPIRILQVVGGMNRGGVETWLMHVLRHIDREQYQIDFLVHTTEPCAYDDEIRALGSKIIPCLHPSQPLAYARNFRHVLREQGPYDVVHSHVHHFTGFVLLLAQLYGVPIRIAHSHSDMRVLQQNASGKRRAYLWLTEQLVRIFATTGLAASAQAAEALYGPDWQQKSKWRILYCGVDLSPFSEPPRRDDVRVELGLPIDAFVVGHVGRFVEVKNHVYFVEIANELLKGKENVYFLLVGEGPLRSEIEKQVQDLGLASRFIFTGARSDVPRLMMGAMDAFLFPSLYEGLGLVLVEAQAAGLPCVVSDTVPGEVDVVPQLMFRCSLQDSPLLWADVIRNRTANICAGISQKIAISTLIETPFNLNLALSILKKIYYSNSVL